MSDLANIRVVIPGIPRGKGRPRARVFHGHARVYTPAVTASEEGAVRLFASQAMQGRPPMADPVEVRLTAFMPVPPSWSARKRQQALAGEIRPTSKPDLDNVAKLAMDGCNAIVFRDDALIVSFLAAKFYSDEPRVEIEVCPALRGGQ